MAGPARHTRLTIGRMPAMDDTPVFAPETCRQYLAPFQDGLSGFFRLHLRFADTRLAVCADAPALIEALAAYHRDFVDDGPADLEVNLVSAEADDLAWPFDQAPGRGNTAKERWIDLPDGRIVRKTRTGLHLVFGPAGNFVLGPVARHGDQVVNAVNCRFMEREIAAGAQLLHAAAVSDGKRGLAIAGLAGAGKSTLALELTRRGAYFVSNDRLLAAPGPHGPIMTGVPRVPRVNPGTILANDSLARLVPPDERLALSRLPEETLRTLERKVDVPIGRCFGPGRFRLRAALAALVVLAWKPGGGPARPTWTRLDLRTELVDTVAKELGPLVAMGPRPVSRRDSLALLGTVPVLLFEGGLDFPLAADWCHDILTRFPASGDKPGPDPRPMP
jgi:HprK-related kinase B